MAADRSRGESGRAENANALRMRGRARAALGQYAAALEPLQQALEIDRALADPRKIVADLAELARVSASAGDAQAARGYEERRVAVRRAMSEAKSPAEMEVLLRR
jgi:tetratricopeptide (TPR) repeat protein